MVGYTSLGTRMRWPRWTSDRPIHVTQTIIKPQSHSYQECQKLLCIFSSSRPESGKDTRSRWQIWIKCFDMLSLHRICLQMTTASKCCYSITNWLVLSIILFSVPFVATSPVYLLWLEGSPKHFKTKKQHWSGKASVPCTKLEYQPAANQTLSVLASQPN
jgi:TM2 domain-containing membrane protein YozV